MKWLVALFLTAMFAGCVAEEPDLNQNGVMDDAMSNHENAPNYATSGRSFAGGQWIGSDPMTHEDLKGKVAFIDFWTYSCINCIRTFPHVTALYDTYAPYGFELIGVHSPEFDFEKNPVNVIQAMDEHGINYPVVQDNDFRIWRSYENRYWPAHYIYDHAGVQREYHFGEGDYEETEDLVRALLVEAGATDLPPKIEPLNTEERRAGSGVTRELYAGYWRQPEALGQGTLRDETVTWTIPEDANPNQIYLEGTWHVGEEAIRAETDGIVQLNFKAGGSNIVADGEGCIRVELDGALIPEENRPFEGDCIQLTGPDSYDFYGGAVERHTVQFHVPAGFELYTFAFNWYEDWP